MRADIARLGESVAEAFGELTGKYPDVVFLIVAAGKRHGIDGGNACVTTNVEMSALLKLLDAVGDIALCKAAQDAGRTRR